MVPPLPGHQKKKYGQSPGGGDWTRLVDWSRGYFTCTKKSIIEKKVSKGRSTKQKLRVLKTTETKLPADFLRIKYIIKQPSARCDLQSVKDMLDVGEKKNVGMGDLNSILFTSFFFVSRESR